MTSPNVVVVVVVFLGGLPLRLCKSLHPDDVHGYAISTWRSLSLSPLFCHSVLLVCHIEGVHLFVSVLVVIKVVSF